MRAGKVMAFRGRLGVGARLRSARQWAATSEGRRFLLVLGAALAIRLAIAPIRGFDHDLQAYATWGEALDHFGAHVYAHDPDVSYPPMTVYFFGFMSGVALIWHGLTGARLDLTVRDSSALMAFMRLPFILSDLLTVGLLYALARRVVSPRLALLATGVYAFLPAILLDGILWPQTDGVMTLGILIAAALALRGRAGWAGAVLAVTILIKPQPLIYAPLLLIYLWRWQGRQAALRAGVGLVGAGTLICLPLLLPPHPDILAFAGNLRAFMATQPMASPSAFNIWWLLGVQHTAAGAPWLGPLSISLVGAALFLGALLTGCISLWRDGSPQTLYIVWAMVALASFDVMSGQRERYTYPCIALFLLAGLYQRRYWALSALVSLTMFANHALVILSNLPGNHTVLDLRGPARYFAAHPLYGVVFSACNVGLLLCGLVMMWRSSARRAASVVGSGTARYSDANSASLSVMQREVEHAGERAV